MQLSSFPAENIENYIGESFSSSRVPMEFKREMIATVLDNLQLCYEMFESYYMSGNVDLSSYITLSNDLENPIQLNQPLNEDNINHLLGIAPTHNRNSMKLNFPIETLHLLGLDPNKYYSAKEVLKRILDKKEDIIDSKDIICGCYKSNNGVLYEMLPWKKIILKTNAFIRGDFFKSTSLIASINESSYITGVNDGINAVAVNSTLFGKSAIYQQIPNITSGEGKSPLLTGESLIGGVNSLYQRNKDIILKGLMTELRKEAGYARITRINGVRTNESFIGERIKTSNGSIIRTMNQPAFLLQGIDSSNGGVIIDVVNKNGIRSTKSLSENILLLEDLVLTFGDVQSVIDLVYEIIEQLKNVYNYTNGKRK